MFNVYIFFLTLFVYQSYAVNNSSDRCLEVQKFCARLALKRIIDDIRCRHFVRLGQGNHAVTLAPFKIKFNRMSKSNSLNRSNSTETDYDHLVNSPKEPPTLSPVLKEGNESETTNKNHSSNHDDPSNENDHEGGREMQLSQSPMSPKAPEIMHTSSKEFYKAVAKQFGITCKMSDHCRCYDCQSHYFDCEYEQNEQEKTDGGLGAGTPVFLHEVMHGSACNIL